VLCVPRKFTESDCVAIKAGVDLISDALPFGRLWYDATSDAVEYAKFRSRLDHAVIRVFDIHEHTVPELTTALPCRRKVAIAARAKAW